MGSLENKVAVSQANLGGGRPTGRKRHAEAQVQVGTGLFRKPHVVLDRGAPRVKENIWKAELGDRSSRNWLVLL